MSSYVLLIIYLSYGVGTFLMSHVLCVCLICSYLMAAVSVVIHLVVLFRNLLLHYH